MVLICCIDVVVVGVLFLLAVQGGIERALPFASFVIVLVPFESRLEAGLFILTTQRLVVVTLAALSVAFPGNFKEFSNRKGAPLKWLMGFSVLWCLVSALNSIVPAISFKNLLSLVLDYYLLYFVCWRAFLHTNTIHRVFRGIVAALGISSVLGAVEVYRHWSVKSLFPPVTHLFDMGGNLLNVDLERGLRVTSTFGHPILFGLALAVGITLDIYLLTITETLKGKILLWLAILPMFLNIYKTGSRGPWIGCSMAMAILFLLGEPKAKKLVVTIGIITVAVLLIRPGIWETFRGIYANSFRAETSTGSSYEYRYALTDAVVKAVDKNVPRMMWGYGMGSDYDLNLQGTIWGVSKTFLSVDSTWLSMLVGVGYVGLGIFLALFSKPALLAWKDYWRQPKPGRYLSLVLLTCLVTYYFVMVGVALFDQNWYMLWILIAATVVCGRLKPTEAQPAGVASKAPPTHIRPIETDVGDPVLLNRGRG